MYKRYATPNSKRKQWRNHTDQINNINITSLKNNLATEWNDFKTGVTTSHSTIITENNMNYQFGAVVMEAIRTSREYMTRLCRNYRVCRTRPNYHWFRQNSVLYDLATQGKSLQKKSVIRWFLLLHCASVLRITQGNWQHFKMATFRAGKLTRKKDWPFSINNK